MKKLVYIGQEVEQAEQLRRILSDDYRFEVIERSEAFDLDDCSLLVIEKRSDAGSHKRNMVRFRSLLGFRDIPIMIILNRSDLGDLQTPSDYDRDLLLITPLDDQKVRAQVQRALSPAGEDACPDDEILDAITKAARRVVGRVAGVEVVPAGSYLKKDYQLLGDICGLMPLKGYLEGSLAIGLSTLLARRLSAAMACCEEDAITDQDLPDGVGEIINQISGNLKTILSEQDKTVDIDLPVVQQGADKKIAETGTLPVVVQLFECGSEPFALFVCLRQNAESFAERREAPASA